ncbi:uncharacterized protein LOC108024303 [Drosophila biarmipes]|uniref:uncharacterized protein LOC108024303 n=1 Tax=Drosophila biarmipes TaxID=125945 RepID=UPI0021CC9B84|nr:uncharacterized protein LOC108024303 [Drosophila biarmipes]
MFEATFLEVYRSCYNPKTMTAHYTIHKVYPTYMKSFRRTTWDRDNLITPAEEALFTNGNIFERFGLILNAGRGKYLTSKRVNAFDRGHLAPSADFTFFKVLGLTNKYLNAIAQSASINRGKWSKLENSVRGLLKDPRLPMYNDVLKVCTGGLGILKLQDANDHPTEIFLYEKMVTPSWSTVLQIPVPEWVYKIVSHSSSNTKLVILVNNNHWDPAESDPKSVCQKQACPQELYKAKNIFCCNYIQFIANIVPRLSGLC